MQAPARVARPSQLHPCLPLQVAGRCLPSAPATSADEGEYEYSANEEKEEKSMRQQLARSHSCSNLQGKQLVPSFKSLLQYRASSQSRLHNNRHSKSCNQLPTQSGCSGASQISKQKGGKCAPKGHVAVYVEAGRERQVVPIAYLSHPHFQALLERAESEFGLRQKGPGLRIPCSLSELHHTLHHIRTQ